MTARVQQFSLFGGQPGRPREARSPRPSKAMGYAAPPGSGPAGETCGTCAHCRLRTIRGERRVYKCRLLQGRWTFDRTTDVRLRSPACAKWQAGAPRTTTIKGNADVD